MVLAYDCYPQWLLVYVRLLPTMAYTHTVFWGLLCPYWLQLTLVICDGSCLHSCYLRRLLPVQCVSTACWLDRLRLVGVTIVSYSKVARCVCLASRRLFTHCGSAHMVSIPDGFTHWLLSAMAFVTHTVFYGSPSRFIRDGM